MSRSGRLLRLAAATLAASPLLLAGCAALTVERPAEPIAQRPSQPQPLRLAIAQLQYGNGAPFEVCAVDTCLRSTQKTFPTAAPTPGVNAVVTPVTLPQSGAALLESPTMLVPAEVSKPLVEPSPKTVTITFASGAAVLTPAARKTLDAMAPEVRNAEVIEIRGRTDEVGSALLNDVLARNRALAVRDYLHEKSLPAHTIIRVNSKGACCYVAANDTEQGRAANRRVEVEFTRPLQVGFRSDRHDPL